MANLYEISQLEKERDSLTQEKVDSLPKSPRPTPSPETKKHDSFTTSSSTVDELRADIPRPQDITPTPTFLSTPTIQPSPPQEPPISIRHEILKSCTELYKDCYEIFFDFEGTHIVYKIIKILFSIIGFPLLFVVSPLSLAVLYFLLQIAKVINIIIPPKHIFLPFNLAFNLLCYSIIYLAHGAFFSLTVLSVLPDYLIDLYS